MTVPVSELLNDLAVAAHGRGRSDEARTLLRAALLVDPADADAHANLSALNAVDPRASSAPPRQTLGVAHTLPPPAPARLDGTLLEYVHGRLAQHTDDWYAGLRILKFPEDLRVYEHLLWQSRASVVVELGSRHGGSALWFRDRLLANEPYGRIDGPPRVITVDVEVADAHRNLAAADPRYAETIDVVEGSVCEPETAARVAALIPPGARTFVVEDSAHTYATTLGSLEHFAPLVTPGGFLVVEDGCVDVERLRIADGWPRGVLPALHDWLETEAGRAFRQRRDLELYGVTCHPEGFLQRLG